MQKNIIGVNFQEGYRIKEGIRIHYIRMHLMLKKINYFPNNLLTNMKRNMTIFILKHILC